MHTGELSHHLKNADNFHQLQLEVSSWLPINCCQKPHPPTVTWKAHMDSSWPKVWDCCIGLHHYSFWYLFPDKLIGGTSITHHMVRRLFMHKYVVRITYLYAILHTNHLLVPGEYQNLTLHLAAVCYAPVSNCVHVPFLSHAWQPIWSVLHKQLVGNVTVVLAPTFIGIPCNL